MCAAKCVRVGAIAHCETCACCDVIQGCKLDCPCLRKNWPCYTGSPCDMSTCVLFSSPYGSGGTYVMDASNPCVYITSDFYGQIVFQGAVDKCLFISASGVLHGGISAADSGKDLVYVAGVVEGDIAFKVYGDMFVDRNGNLKGRVTLAAAGSWFDACQARLEQPIVGLTVAAPNHNCFSVALLLPPMANILGSNPATTDRFSSDAVNVNMLYVGEFGAVV